MCQQWRKGEEKSEYRPFSFLTDIYHRKQHDNKQRSIDCLFGKHPSDPII